MIAPSGTRLTYVAEFDVSFWDSITYGSQSEGDILAAVTSALQQMGIVVEGSGVNQPIFVGQGSVTFQLAIQNSYGGATDGLDDIRRIVDHQFYLVSSLPTASRITNYTLPGESTQATGAPAAPSDNPNTSCWNDSSKSALDCLGVNKVGGGLTTIAIVLVVGLIGVFAVKEFL